MSKPLTPAEKAIAKAQDIKAELACDSLQSAKDKLSVSNARRGFRTSNSTRTERIASKVQDRIEMTMVLQSLPEKVKALLTSKLSAQPDEPTTETPADVPSNGNGKGKGTSAQA